MNTAPSAPTLLHLDASPRGSRSHSRRLGGKFLATWRAAHPGARVIEHDLSHQPPPFVSEAWVEGAFAPPDQQSPAAREAIALSDRYVAELLTADQIVRVGRTFSAGPDGLKGLVQGKRVIVIVASGSDFRPTSPGGAYNFVEPYLRAVLGFIGIAQVEFVYAHSLNTDAAREQVLAEADRTLSTLAA